MSYPVRFHRLAARAPTDGISTGAGSRRRLAALALPERVGPEGVRQLPAGCARPVKPHSWLEGPADPARGHKGNGRTPTDHFIQD